jgi:hypothetical protein
MNIKSKLITVLLSFIASPVFAATYPEFGGITLSKDTTAAQYIIYFFNLIVAVGAFIAVIMVIMAGIEWVTSSGNPSKIESAKSKIANTLIGVGVLVGSYFILNTINPQLTNIKIDDLTCSHGIVVSVKKSDGKITQECIDSSQNVLDTITSTIGWKIVGTPYLKVYTYSEPNYLGTIKEYDCRTGACSGSLDITGAKSIYFVPNDPGIYLYDNVDYKPGSRAHPISITTNLDLENPLNIFDNVTKSIDIVNPDQSKQKIMYQAVAFNDPGYVGKCAFIAKPVSDVNMATSEGYTDKIDNLSSIIVVKMNLDPLAISQDQGDVILYNTASCDKTDSSPDAVNKKSCRIQILTWSKGQINILDYCKNFNSGDEVQSFEITGAAGLVLSTGKVDSKKTSDGSGTSVCRYFSKQDISVGTCYTKLLESGLYVPGGIKPQSFIVIPDN